LKSDIEDVVEKIDISRITPPIESKPETARIPGVLFTDGLKGSASYNFIVATQVDDKRSDRVLIELANFFLESGEFHWNAGIFMWSLKSIDNALRTYLPEVHNLFLEGEALFGTSEERQFIQKVYSECKTISIDYGVMERAKNVFSLCAEFGWSDLGTWKSLYENSEKDEAKNVVFNGENLIVENAYDNIIRLPENKQAIIKDLEGFIVVDSGEALLICKTENEQELKESLNELKRKLDE
jgi:mannose-1-phosphate guanylyltransferase